MEMRTLHTGRTPAPKSGGAHHWEKGGQDVLICPPSPPYTYIYTGHPLSHQALAQPCPLRVWGAPTRSRLGPEGRLASLGLLRK